ncbi:MAG TPA: hypothetical protein VKR60_04655 [Candidatus Sulfotelmatobacter sp.]|nr:hypothetical protein [Candidatus Sulfotelmatobacter sp.]
MSPLEVHGRALIHEVIAGPEIEWSWGANVVVKNISNKPITLVFATLTELGRHPESGHPAGLGDGPKYIIAEDRFFKTDIQPSDSVVLRDTKPGVLGRGCCVNSVDKVRSPEAEFEVIFVQYADGSTFGNPAAATEVFARRKAIVTALQQLIESQADDGDHFNDKLSQQCASLGNPICPQINRALGRGGERAALAEARRLLDISERHAKLLATYSAN